MTKNRQWIYARKPNAQVGPENFDLHEAEMPEARDGQVLVKTTLLSLDPASRAWMQGATYRSALNPGDVMAGWGLGEVVESHAKGFEPCPMCIFQRIAMCGAGLLFLLGALVGPKAARGR